jgi:hypothetical protein
MWCVYPRTDDTCESWQLCGGNGQPAVDNAYGNLYVHIKDVIKSSKVQGSGQRSAMAYSTRKGHTCCENACAYIKTNVKRKHSNMLHKCSSMQNIS